MKISFKGYGCSDSFDLNCTEEVIVLEGISVLKAHTINTDNELMEWISKVKNYFICDVGRNHVTFSNRVRDNRFAAVCLDCGYYSSENFTSCPECYSKELPVYLEL